MTDKLQVQEFFSTMMPEGIPPGFHTLVWTLPDKTSYWHTTTKGAINEAVKQANTSADVYIGVGLTEKELGRKQRTSNSNVSAIFGLWADIDYADAVHTKKNLPTEVEALDFIRNEIPKKPTMIVHSGHGFQVWWALNGIYQFDDSGRNHVTAIARGWIYKIRDLARAKGWDVDATIDLARVLRIPGTVNRKTDDIRPVTIIHSDAKTRYAIADFNGTVAPVGRQKRLPIGDAQVIETGTLKLDPTAEPPPNKFVALFENNELVPATWKHQRKDFQDGSPSVYDLALASFAAYADWTDQEIADLLIAHRRKHGLDLKLREDYYIRTIAKARNRTRVEAQQSNDGESSREEDSETAQDKVESFLGIDIVSFKKYPGDPPSYSLALRDDSGETISISMSIEQVLSPKLFRQQVAAATGQVIELMKQPQWDAHARRLLRVCVVESLGPESSPAGLARQWIREYFEAYPPIEEEWEGAALNSRPFIKDGIRYFSLQALTFWLRNSQGERVASTRELARLVRMAGLEPHTINVPGAGDRLTTTRSVWRERTIGALALQAASRPEQTSGEDSNSEDAESK